jgi:uncharacterized protein
MSVTASRYNVKIPLRHGRALVYNSMSGASALLEPRELAKLRRVELGAPVRRDDVLNTLIYGGFAVEDSVDELRRLEQEYRQARFDSSAMVLTIAPTLACNFGCDYCFQGADKPCGKMASDVQAATIALVERCLPTIRRLHVAWYGGEPLLGMPVIEALSDQIIPICERSAVDYDAMIVTNGHRLTAECAEWLRRIHVRVAQVTLDGAKEYHDKRRTLLSGKGTFDRIIGNLKSVVEGGELRVVVRINIDSRNSSDIAQLLQFLHAAELGHHANFSVYFAPVEAITEGCHVVASQCMTKNEYAELETELHRQAYELGLADLPYPRRFLGLCGAMRPRGFVVVPNGDLHKCWDTVSWPEMRIGTIFEPEAAVVSPTARKWADWTPFENESCRACKLLPSCAGSCAHKFVNPEQTLGEAGALPCPSWKYQLKERIVSRAVRQGMISEVDYDPRAIATDPTEICSIAPPKQMLRSASRARVVSIAGAA